MNKENKIVCAAMHFELLDVIIPCIRHWDSIAHKLTGDSCYELDEKIAIQGFLDSKGKFHDRKEAMKIAVVSRQVSCSKPVFKNGEIKELYSEDLY